MPPRLHFSSILGPSPLCLRPAKPTTSCSLPLISIAHGSSSSDAKEAKKRRLLQQRDPYVVEQIEARKAANIQRQKVLQEQRKSVLGDPVRGTLTPFVQSFDTAATSSLPSMPSSSTALAIPSNKAPTPNLNYFLKPHEVEKALQHSFILTQPLLEEQRDKVDPVTEARKIEEHQAAHERAVAAISRIVNLKNGSAKERMRVNMQRCIETFGRHNTDQSLGGRTPSNVPRGPDALPAAEPTPRAGPDTGSSEVQVAILTAKIRSVADMLERTGNKDKMNKRNLRILVHKRQKLLKYLKRKEHGGPRFQNLVETLGLTDGTWKGEITM